jgi:hypothetical protein
MIISHPDNNKPIAIAKAWDFPESANNEEFFLREIKGSPSDGYKAFVYNSNGEKVAIAHNHMDGDGWYVSYNKT